MSAHAGQQIKTDRFGFWRICKKIYWGFASTSRNLELPVAQKNDQYITAVTAGLRRRLQEKLSANPKAFGTISAEIVLQDGQIVIADVGEKEKIKL